MKILKSLSLCLSAMLFLCGFVTAQKMKPEEILAKHLEAIGTADARSAVKNMIAVGEVTAKLISKKNVPVKGRIVMASAGAKNFIGMSLNSSTYPLEKFSYNGDKSNIAFISPGSRSVLGNFLQSNKELIENGVFGGVLSNSWSLLNLDKNKIKISFDGTKKIDGKDSYAVSYGAKGDLDIVMYFDKATFQHLRTEYKRTTSAGIGSRPEQSTGYNETRLKITEDFSDFRAEKKLVLPHKYQINYSLTGQNQTIETEWVFNLTEFAVNQKLDDKTFDPDSN